MLCSKSLLDDREFIYVYIIIIYIYIIFRIIGLSSSLVGMPFLTNWYKEGVRGFWTLLKWGFDMVTIKHRGRHNTYGEYLGRRQWGERERVRSLDIYII